MFQLEYWVIISVFNPFGQLLLGSGGAVTSLVQLSVLLSFILFPIGLLVALFCVWNRKPSIYQGGLIIAASIFWIYALAATKSHIFIGPYVALLGGIILEASVLLSGNISLSRHSYSRSYSSKHHYDYQTTKTPIFYWILILVIILVINALMFLNFIKTGTELYQILNTISKFTLFLPGVVIIPLIVGIFIGRSVEHSENDVKKVLRKGFLKSINACITYLVSITIVYLIFLYLFNNAPKIGYAIIYWYILPSLILISASALGAVIMYSKHLE